MPLVMLIYIHIFIGAMVYLSLVVTTSWRGVSFILYVISVIILLGVPIYACNDMNWEKDKAHWVMGYCFHFLLTSFKPHYAATFYFFGTKIQVQWKKCAF